MPDIDPIFPTKLKFGWMADEEGEFVVAIGIEHPAGEDVVLAVEPDAFEQLCQQFNAFLNGGFGQKPH